MPDDTALHDVEIHDVEAVNRKTSRSLYQKRVKIHPRRARGTFRKLKWWIMGVTLAIYYFTPWIRWDRGPDLPNQAVLIDFPARRFYFFFIEIWPQELFFVAGLLIMAAVGLFLTTSVAGRMWCGYSCPQTVWTDLFIAVERFVEGDRNARLRLDKAPWSMGKIAKRVVKHAIWLVIAMCTGGAWIFYFANAPTLAAELPTLHAPGAAYITIGILTATTYLLGGFAREQVCTYMCPWPRIMGAMMDEESLVVTYREGRGEPRGAHKKGASWEGRGDCVDCNACVSVCPMGIDIRDGQQLECITCALCIDACDDVMTKVGRPKGLIGYASLANETRVARGEPSRLRVIRPRTLIYFGLWALVGVIMLYALLTRPSLDINVLRDRNPLFVRLADGDIRNGYTFKILNKSHETRSFSLTVKGVDGLKIRVIGQNEDGVAEPVFTLRPDKLESYRVLLTAPRRSLKAASNDIEFVTEDVATHEIAKYDSVFVGPGS